MNYKIFILVLIFLLLKIANLNHKIQIQVKNSEFYEENKNLIDEAVNQISNHCKTKRILTLNLNFDYIPVQLQIINSQQIGFTSSFKDFTLIELNKNYWEISSEEYRKSLIFHEIGHALGLEHSQKENEVMSQPAPEKPDFEAFLGEIEDFCKKLNKIPDIQKY